MLIYLGGAFAVFGVALLAIDWGEGFTVFLVRLGRPIHPGIRSGHDATGSTPGVGDVMNSRRWPITFSCLLFLLVAGGLHTGAAEVETHGALKAIFHKGQIESVVALDTLLPDPDLYAVGALGELAGEIHDPWRNRLPFVSPGHRRDPYRKRLDVPMRGATLLVSSAVTKWKTTVLTEVDSL